MKSRLVIYFNIVLYLALSSCDVKNDDCYLSPPYYQSFLPLKVSFDLDYVLENNEDNKPILIVFTGISSNSIKGVEWKLLLKENIQKNINKFNIVCLLIDDRRHCGVDSLSIGDKNRKTMITMLGMTATPAYVILNEKGVFLRATTTFPAQERQFLDFLEGI